MALKRKIRRITKVSRQMTDPDPNFVSVVDHGANQAPFRVLKKSEKPGVDASLIQKTKKTAADPTVEIQRITFDQAQFAAADKVIEWMTAKGYETEGVDIVSGDPGFTVNSGLAEDKFEEVKGLDAGGGVTIYGGKLKEETEKAAEPAPALSYTVKGLDGPALVKKYDFYAGMFSSGTTLDGVLQDGLQDGVPPGLHELNDAFYGALRNVLTASEGNRTKRVADLCKEFGEFINKLADIFQAHLTPEEAVKHLLDKPASKEPETDMTTKTTDKAPAQKTAGEAPKAPAVTEPAKEPEKKGTEPAPVATDPPKEPEAKGTAEEPKPADAKTEEAAGEDPVAKAVAAALAPVISGIKTVTDAVAKVAEDVAKTNERVAAIEERPAARKGIDTTHESGEVDPKASAPKSPEDKSAKEFAEKMNRNRFGFLNQRG